MYEIPSHFHWSKGQSMSTQINEIAHTQLRKVIATQLRTAILENEIKPGEWLRQEQVADKYGVSQTPVREALNDLASEGLVEHVPYRGVRVVEFTLQDVQDLYACRAFIEAVAARYAAQNMTAEELAEVKKVFGELEQHSGTQDVVEHRKLHRRLHQLIYAASRHPYLIHALDQMWAAYPTMMLANFPQTARGPIPGRGTSARQEHRAIVRALHDRDAAQAERLMRQHVQATADSIATTLKNNSTKPSSRREIK